MKTRNIVVTGFANSGKTVFLTSLLWHLNEGGKDLGLSESFEINTKIHNYKTNPDSLNVFQLKKNMEMLMGLEDTKWPDKTTNNSVCPVIFRTKPSATVKKSDNKPGHLKTLGSRAIKIGKAALTKLQSVETMFQFFDFPGERFADYRIYLTKEFKNWSDGEIRNSRGIQTYMDRLKGEKNPVIYIKEYKKYLVDSYFNGDRHFVSPSYFALNEQGRTIGDAEYNGRKITRGDYENEPEKVTEAISGQRYTGLDIDHEFCPVPESLEKTDKGAYKKLEKSYKDYREKVVVPIFKWLESSYSLIFLIDVADILSRGRPEYVNLTAFFDDIYKNLEKTKIFAEKKRIAFVANKADIFIKQDLRYLLQFSQKLVNEKLWEGKCDVMTFCCSPCISTTEEGDIGNDNREIVILRGTVIESGKSDDNKDLKYRPYPKDWAEKTWDKYYPIELNRGAVLVPRVSQNPRNPPNQYHLKEILNFILFGKKG